MALPEFFQPGEQTLYCWPLQTAASVVVFACFLHPTIGNVRDDLKPQQDGDSKPLCQVRLRPWVFIADGLWPRGRTMTFKTPAGRPPVAYSLTSGKEI